MKMNNTYIRTVEAIIIRQKHFSEPLHRCIVHGLHGRCTHNILFLENQITFSAIY